jgi:putative transcriptional regulator
MRNVSFSARMVPIATGDRLFGSGASSTMNSLKGRLLIATPGVLDPNFARTVLLMLEHNENGAIGLVLNRLTEATISDLAGKVFEEGFDWDKPIHLGGPVTGPFMVIHAIEDLADHEIIPGVYHTLEATKVQEIISRKPEPSVAIANYAGWGPGQLEGEFDEDSWLTLPATSEHVFWAGDKDLWKVVVNEVNAKKLSDFLGLGAMPSDPRVN